MVADPDERAALRRLQAHVDARRGGARRVFAGVVHQVEQDLLDRGAVHVHGQGAARGRRERHLQVGARGALGQAWPRLLHEGLEIDGLPRGLPPPALDARVEQHVLHQVAEPLRLAAQPRDVLAAPPFVRDHAVGEHVRVEAEGRERRAQLVRDRGDEHVPALAQLDHAAQEGGHGQGGQEGKGPGPGQGQARGGRAGPLGHGHGASHEPYGQRRQPPLLVRARARRHRLQSRVRQQVLDGGQEVLAQARPVQPRAPDVLLVADPHSAREQQYVADPERRRWTLPRNEGARCELARHGRGLGEDGVGEALLAGGVFLDVLHFLHGGLIVGGHHGARGRRGRLAGESRGQVGAAEGGPQRLEPSREGRRLRRRDLASGSDLESEEVLGRHLRPALQGEERDERRVQPPEGETCVLLERGLGPRLLLRALQSQDGEADPHHRAQEGGGAGGEDEPDAGRPHEPPPSSR